MWNGACPLCPHTFYTASDQRGLGINAAAEADHRHGCRDRTKLSRTKDRGPKFDGRAHALTLHRPGLTVFCGDAQCGRRAGRPCARNKVVNWAGSTGAPAPARLPRLLHTARGARGSEPASHELLFKKNEGVLRGRRPSSGGPCPFERGAARRAGRGGGGGQASSALRPCGCGARRVTRWSGCNTMGGRTPKS